MASHIYYIQEDELKLKINSFRIIYKKIYNMLDDNVMGEICSFIPHHCKWCGKDIRQYPFLNICYQCSKFKTLFDLYLKRNKKRRNVDKFSYRKEIFYKVIKFTDTRDYVNNQYYYNVHHIIDNHSMYSKMILIAMQCLCADKNDVTFILDECSKIITFILKNNKTLLTNSDKTCYRRRCNLCDK